MNKRKTLLYTSVSLLITSILYTIIIKTVDVKIIGPNGTSVGLAGINSFFHNMFGQNKGWYKITKYLGIIPFLIILFMFLIVLANSWFLILSISIIRKENSLNAGIRKLNPGLH